MKLFFYHKILIYYSYYIFERRSFFIFKTQNFFSCYISIITFFIIFSSICFYSLKNNNASNEVSYPLFFSSSSEFFWPTPGYNQITSYFGKRVSPTSGASSNHSGIDIAAPENTNIYAIMSGRVSFVGFLGASGYSIIISSNEYDIYYSHVSPNFIVSKNQIITQKDLIANVGPKYVDKRDYNSYKDYTGKSTNGATTGTHLHLTIKKDGIAVNPLDFF